MQISKTWPWKAWVKTVFMTFATLLIVWIGGTRCNPLFWKIIEIDWWITPLVGIVYALRECASLLCDPSAHRAKVKSEPEQLFK
jgi:hypothetical protein